MNLGDVFDGSGSDRLGSGAGLGVGSGVGFGVGAGVGIATDPSIGPDHGPFWFQSLTARTLYWKVSPAFTSVST